MTDTTQLVLYIIIALLVGLGIVAIAIYADDRIHFKSSESSLNDFCTQNGYSYGTLWLTTEVGRCWNISYIGNEKIYNGVASTSYDKGRWWFSRDK